MSEELIKRIYESVKSRWGSLANYIVVKNAVKRFVELNPTADPLTIDWAEYYRIDFDYEELLRELKKAYPIYRWGLEREISEEQYFNELYSYLLSQAKELPEDLRLKLLRELQAEFGFEELKEAKVEVVAEPETAQRPEFEEKPIISLSFLAKYPMLDEARKIIAGFKIDQIPQEAFDRAYESILEAVKHGIISTKLDNPLVEILSKPLLVIFAGLMPSEWLKHRIALSEALRMEKQMYVDSDAVFNFFIERFNNLGLKIVKNDECKQYGEYKVYFVDYLKIAKPLLSEPRWKMVNRVIDGGYVFLNKAEVIRLIRAFYQQTILSKILNINLREVPEKIKLYVETIKPKIFREVMNVKGVVEEVRSVKGIAPCMKMIMSKIKASDEVTHFENFAIASYLLNLGYSVDEVLELFKNRADYDEKIARYQVEHIAGLRGSRIKYKPPSCDRFKSLGLCYKNGSECPRWIKNPLRYREGVKNEGREVS